MENFREYAEITYKYLRKLLVVLLLGLAAWELFEAGRFFLVTYPELEASLQLETLSTNEVQEVTTEAIASSISSCINMFFAVRVFKGHSKFIEMIEFITGSSLVVWHRAMIEWLSIINYVALWERLW